MFYRVRGLSGSDAVRMHGISELNCEFTHTHHNLFPTLVRAALTASFQVSSRQLNISWIVTSGQWPDIVVRAQQTF